MKLNGMVLVKVAALLLFVGVSATVEAGLDLNSMISQVVNGDIRTNYEIKSTTTACCDHCRCTRSFPPQCSCSDIKETCHSACKTCICTRSIPPQCRCTDITDFCYEKCSNAVKG